MVMDSDRCEGGLGVWSGCSLPPRWEHRESQDSPEYLCRMQGFPARIQSADEIISMALLPAGNMEFACSSTRAPCSWGAQMRLGVAGSGSNDMSHPLKILPGHRGGGQAP